MAHILVHELNLSYLHIDRLRRCFVDQGNRWHFEVCFFDKAYQKEPHSNQNSVNLGTWRGFTEDYTLAVFDGGDFCGQVSV